MASNSTASCYEIDNSFQYYAQDCRGGFDFTLLFEETILTALPLGILVLISPLRIWNLLNRPTKVVESFLLPLKIASYAGLGAAQLALLTLWTLPNTERTSASIPVQAISFGSTGVFCLLSYFEHTRSVRPSFLLNVYLFLTLLFDIARCRTLWLRDPNTYGRTIAVLFTASVALKAVLVLLEGLEKRWTLRSEYKDYPPEATASTYNRSFFSWLNPLFMKGFTSLVRVDDLFVVDKDMLSERVHARLEAAWNKVAKKTPYSLFLVSLSTLKWHILAVIPPRAFLIALNFCQPLLINRAVYLSVDNVTPWTTHVGYGLIGAYIIVYVGAAIAMGQYQHLSYRAITMVRGGLISMLTRKTTDLSVRDVDPASSLTLMSADIERIVQGWQTMHEMWANLIEIAVAIVLLEAQLGVSCVIPVAVAITSLVASILFLGIVVSRQALWLEAIEKRISATTAMLGSMKGIKMTGLKNVLFKSIHGLRLDELDISKGFRRLLIWNMGLAYLSQIFAPIITFAVFVSLSHDHGDDVALNTARVYTALSIFALMTDPITTLVMSLSAFAGSVGSFTRIQEFLDKDVLVDERKVSSLSEVSSEEFNKYDVAPHVSEKSSFAISDNDTLRYSGTGTPVRSDTPQGDMIIVHDADFSWDLNGEPLIKSITLTVQESKLSMVVGPVGCGKSTLLKAILGEVPLARGSVYTATKQIAYCDQTAWHMNDTIRNSITTSSDFDEQWYDTVLNACALYEDLRQLPRGDQTMIGSKGVALSTGQGQRIALARAVYARKKLVILDDPFSGLDTSTENHIFHSLMGKSGIWRAMQVTILIVSSSAKRLPYADHIIAMDEKGAIMEQGQFDVLAATGGYVSSFNLPQADWNYTPDDRTYRRSGALLATPNNDKVIQTDDDLEAEANRATGDFTIYRYYFSSVGWMGIIVFVICISGFVFCISFPSIWVKWWAASNVQYPYEKTNYYLGMYVMLGVVAMITLCISCWQLIITMVPKTGERFHFTLLNTVLSAPNSFFASTDIGVTLNRFSQDLQLIDMELPVAALNAFATLVLCIAQTTLIGVASPYTAISFPIVLIALYFIQKFYLRTSRQLRFMDLEAKAPLYSQFTECLSGLVTIRAFGWQKAMEKKSRDLLEKSQRPFYLLFAVQRWLTLVLDLVVACIATILIILVVELRGSISAGYVGVALFNIIQFSQSIKLLITFWTTLETHIGSIARVKIFNETVKSEDEPGENGMVPPEWPGQGAIELKSVSAGYRPDEPILRNISISIRSGEKIGICGRTGSGKSSLVLAIFRMIELSGGSISIDGIDLTTIPRQEIRSRITGVAQDPFLIKGSVRLNADPTGKATDEAIWDALRSVHLQSTVEEKGSLDVDIEEVYLSHGQKQLFCLARAMLRHSSILILDEATSNVDSKTDEIMQRVIREKFSNHTILAVAHKLDTILDFDKVAMLDAGQLIEFDDPYTLLSTDSAFNRLYTYCMAEEDEKDGQLGVEVIVRDSRTQSGRASTEINPSASGSD
ncbi:putative ABC multidrug transporter [Talaromyces proteolyticus]|uniref:ABC multidrug transporter n=1 Tax=Talaromyces proteolyticus TaxID=1131652 RepID=A0AAD4KXP9_9EURO|nr:putative ABC multidrug transporter [Talaromyces proteolyticus]KAH8701117.1 putative ABC multidrug transporter [Talaromyces proteolyticus]